MGETDAEAEWWRDQVFYEIFVRSFQDREFRLRFSGVSFILRA